MPGYDGTGPRGCGPMTGGGDGYCVMRVPEDLDQPRIGFAGLCGRPVSYPSGWVVSDSASLAAQIACIGNELAILRGCIRKLEAAVCRVAGGNSSGASFGSSERPDRGAS